MTAPTVLLADDHAMLLEAFKALPNRNSTSSGTVTDGRMLLTECSRLNPDVVLDITAMPLLNGLDAGRQLRAHRRSVRWYTSL